MDTAINILQLENNYFVTLQDKADSSILPKVASRIFQSKDPRIIDINATDAELLIVSNDLSEVEISEIISSTIKIQGSHLAKSTEPISIPVCYDLGQDWSEVETQIGITKQQYIDLLSKLEFSLAMFGFIPGFSYLDGLPKSMQCSRKSKPSKKIAANTLALGGKYIGIYGLDSPGGWLDIGSVATSLINIPNKPPHLLDFESQLRFEAISIEEYNNRTKTLS